MLFLYLCAQNMSILLQSVALVTDPTWVFICVLLTIIFAPLVMKRLHMPHIIGMILAGILLGEHGLGILENDRSFEIFGQVGIYYIMFTAGLGLDMGAMVHYKKKGIMFGLLTFLIPLILGYLSVRYVLDFEVGASIVVATIFSSHTLVSYPIMSRYGMARHEDVTVSVLGTAFTTFCSLVVLAVAVGMHSGKTDAMWCVQFTLKCIAYLVFVITVFPRVGRWFLRRYDDQVMQFSFVLIMVFLSAALASLAGLAGLLGAFLGGLVVNRLIPRTSPLMNRIEFFGNALFIPYFLISVGMIINLKAMFADWRTVEVAVVMVIVACFTKWLAAWVMTLLSKGSREGRIVMFGLSTAHAAGALAIVIIATSPGVEMMEEAVLDSTVMLILLSCIVSAVATNIGAKRLALLADRTDDNRGASHGKCLVTYSQEESVESMTQLAMMMRNKYLPDPLMGLTVTFEDSGFEQAQRRAKQLLAKAQELTVAAEVSMQTMSRMSTNVAGGIMHTMREYDCGEVMVCLRDRETGMPKASLGSVIDAVLAGSHLELLAVRIIVTPGTIRRVVLAVPEKAEYEVGFYKWLEHICRIVEELDGNLVVYAFHGALEKIRTYLWQQHITLRAEYNELMLWKQFTSLQTQLGENDLLVLVTSRPGFISYSKQLDALPLQIHRYLAGTSVILLYPDQGE